MGFIFVVYDLTLFVSFDHDTVHVFWLLVIIVSWLLVFRFVQILRIASCNSLVWKELRWDLTKRESCLMPRFRMVASFDFIIISILLWWPLVRLISIDLFVHLKDRLPRLIIVFNHIIIVRLDWIFGTEQEYILLLAFLKNFLLVFERRRSCDVFIRWVLIHLLVVNDFLEVCHSILVLRLNQGCVVWMVFNFNILLLLELSLTQWVVWDTFFVSIDIIIIIFKLIFYLLCRDVASPLVFQDHV